jgi:hypothetical protein
MLSRPMKLENIKVQGDSERLAFDEHLVYELIRVRIAVDWTVTDVTTRFNI